VSTTSSSPDESDRERSIRLMRARKNARLRKERSKARRAAALKSGEAPTVTVREFSELSGLSQATVRRRIDDGILRIKERPGKGSIKFGRVLIYASQLG
jgi:hypothetical protein